MQITLSNEYPDRATEIILKLQHGQPSVREASGPQHAGSLPQTSTNRSHPCDL